MLTVCVFEVLLPAESIEIIFVAVERPMVIVPVPVSPPRVYVALAEPVNSMFEVPV
jgi:hypothetical protein